MTYNVFGGTLNQLLYLSTFHPLMGPFSRVRPHLWEVWGQSVPALLLIIDCC